MLMRERMGLTRVAAVVAGPSTGRGLGKQGRSTDPMDHVLAPSANRNARSNDVIVGLRIR